MELGGFMINNFLAVYFCGHEQCQPAHSFGPAIRPHYLLHIIIKGKGIFKKDKHTYHLKAGDAFLIHPMESTYYRADDLEPWEYTWIGFDGKLVDDILSETCFHHDCVFIAEDSPLPLLGLSIWKYFLEPNHNFITLNGYLLQILGNMKIPSIDTEQDYSKKYLQTAMEYINNNYGYPIKISEIAAFIGIDRTYLYRIFMENEHISPKQYLLQVRVRNAANMLRSPKYTVTEIAYSCGFKDAAAFCNQFKKITGLTPKNYRHYIKVETNFSKP